MSAATDKTDEKQSAKRQADSIFRALKEISYKQTDRMFAWLIAFEWLAAMAAASILTPRVLPSNQPLQLLVTASALAGMIYLFPLFLALRHPGRPVTRHVIAAGQMLTPSLFIYLTGGGFETHFFIFGALASLASYRDVRILASATVVVAGDHFLGQWIQTMVDGVPLAPWSWTEFTGWVLFEDLLLSLWIWESLRLMSHVALHQAEQQVLHETIEAEVAEHLEALHQENVKYKESQALLQKSEAKFRTLGESAPDCIFLADRIGQWVYCNSPWTRMTGLTNAESMGHGWIRALHPEDKDRILAQLDQALRDRKEFSQEFRIMSDTARLRWVSCRTAPVQYETVEKAEVGGYAGSIKDISSYKEVEEALRRAKTDAEAAVRAKSEFLAKMSHEIRTPMNGVIGMTSLLSDTEMTSQQREYADTIRRSAESLLLLINDVLDFSKVEARRLIFETIDFNLQETIEGSLELLAETAQAKNIELAGFVLADVPTQLRGDPGRLRQVFVNLVSNAVKFTEYGEVVVSVANLAETETHVDLRLEVRDTGIGIPAEVQPRLFQVFSQADSSTTRKYGGTGLGLAISKQLIELMGGQIGFTSVPGQGSTFWFTARFEKQTTAKADLEPINLSNLHVLIVDDNQTNRRIMEDQLQAWGIRATSAAGAQEALEKLQDPSEPRFDIVLLDMHMPGMNGIALAEVIKADSRLARARIIILTSLGNLMDDAQLERIGVDACLVKPVKQARLYECLTGMRSPPRKTVETKPLAQTTPGAPAEPLRILLAEDNAINQKVAVAQLRKLGYSPDVVGNGLEALETAQPNRYDVILMDCQMPQMDGYESSRQIRQREKAENSKPVYIIAMTANAMQGDREKCLEAQMNDYLSKPVKVTDLRAALERSQAGSAIDTTEEEDTSLLLAETVGGEALLDVERLEAAANDDPKVVQELVELYFAQAKDLMNGLRAAINSDSPKDVDHFAHKLVGASLACGMSAMVLPLRELEKRGKEGKLGDAETLFDRASRHLELTRNKVGTYIRQQQNL